MRPRLSTTVVSWGLVPAPETLWAAWIEAVSRVGRELTALVDTVRAA